MDNKFSKNNWLNDLYKITDWFICLLSKFISYIFIIIFLVLFCISLVYFVYKDIVIYIVKAISFCEWMKSLLLFSLQYLLTPFITIGTAYFIMKQWQINNMIKMREHITKAIQEYRDNIKELAKRYEKLVEEYEKSETNKYEKFKEFEEEFERISNDKEYCIDKYLTELEALSLYLHYEAIDEQICREFFLDTIIGIFQEEEFSVVKNYIFEERKRSQKYFKYLIKIYDKWNQEENDEYSK